MLGFASEGRAEGAEGGASPVDEVSDLIQAHSNHFPDLEEAAEALRRIDVIVKREPAEPHFEAVADEVTEEILRTCVEAGGVITGEHGVGSEKQDFMGLVFGEADLEADIKYLSTMWKKVHRAHAEKPAPAAPRQEAGARS